MQSKLSRFVFGPPKDVKDPDAFHKLSLVALLAWVGLGADGLSSSSYGPDEAYRALGEHTSLAFFLAISMALTVLIISYGYSRIIEQFPGGGGGYVVASKLLGPRVGVVSGAALLVDYVLTITTSMASGADAIFSMLPPTAQPYKLVTVFVGLAVLTVMNIRGVKESVSALVPVFGVFLATHAVLLVAGIGGHLGDAGRVAAEVHTNLTHTTATLGIVGTLAIFARAYSLGGSAYTGIEAVSNGVAMMREPRVKTAKRTMVLMAVSLAVTAGGILLSYLLVGAHVPSRESGRTMNWALVTAVSGGWHPFGLPVGTVFQWLTLMSEGLLLFVAAQAGFLDGPRVMANMAVDSWFPHRFAALSDRLSMRNGVTLMGIAACLVLAYSRGDISTLLVMYSINVFVTFSLSNLAMSRYWIRHRKDHPDWWRHLPAHVLALVLCMSILGITIYEKFGEGGWVTLVVTALLVAVCFAIKQHYQSVIGALRRLDDDLPSPEELEAPVVPEGPDATFADGPIKGLSEHHGERDPDPNKPVAILLVGAYSGLGRHAILTLLRMFPGHFQGIVFVSIAVVDSESFKGAEQVGLLEKRTREGLLWYEQYARSLDLRAASAFAVGTEVPMEAEKIAAALVRRYPRALFVAGQLIFEEDSLWNRALHNETAFMVQTRLQRLGIPMIVVPVRIDLGESRPMRAPRLPQEL